MPNPVISKEARQAITEAQVETVVSLSLLNTPLDQIVAETGLSRYMVNKLINSDKFKDTLKERTDEAVSTAKSTLKAAITSRMPAIISVIDHHLKEKNLEAVKVLLKAIGMEQTESNQGPTNIQITLPSGVEPVTVVESEVVE
jgi:hypothetical protein